MRKSTGTALFSFPVRKQNKKIRMKAYSSNTCAFCITIFCTMYLCNFSIMKIHNAKNSISSFCFSCTHNLFFTVYYTTNNVPTNSSPNSAEVINYNYLDVIRKFPQIIILRTDTRNLKFVKLMYVVVNRLVSLS